MMVRLQQSSNRVVHFGNYETAIGYKMVVWHYELNVILGVGTWRFVISDKSGVLCFALYTKLSFDFSQTLPIQTTGCAQSSSINEYQLI